MLRIPLKPKKCPKCNSTTITMNSLGDMSCRNCPYQRLSDHTLKRKQENDNRNN